MKAGDKWKTPPHKLVVQRDLMYGRGVLDSKGPIMGALFALALLKEQGVVLKRSIRVTFGTDEESGSHDIPAYLKHERALLVGFTPDGKYSVVYAERGLMRCQIELPLDKSDRFLQKLPVISIPVTSRMKQLFICNMELLNNTTARSRLVMRLSLVRT